MNASPVSTSTAGAALSILPQEPPEFLVIEPAGTLRIPLSNIAIPTTMEISPVHVERGQRLPVATVGSSHRAVAPASGTLTLARDAVLLSGQTTPAVDLICDANQPPVAEPSGKSDLNTDPLQPLQSIRKDDLGSWIERLREAGVWADRRGSPDLLSQLFQAMKRPIDTVICSLLDADTTACINAAVAAQFSLQVLAGITIISRITSAAQTWICADQRVPGNWWSRIRRLVRKMPLRLMTIPNDYPQADPTLLLYTLLNRRLRPGRLPVEQGVLVLDAAAAMAVGRCALADEPMLRVPIVVRDHVTKLSHFMLAPVGMAVGDLMTRLVCSRRPALLRGGDLLRDLILREDAVVSGSELIIHASDPEPQINPDACIRCGWCIEACPTRVQPAVILEAAQRLDEDLAGRAGIEACIDCGICSYVCPSKLPLLDGIRQMRRTTF